MKDDLEHQDASELVGLWNTDPSPTVRTAEPVNRGRNRRVDIVVALRANLPIPAFSWPVQYVSKLDIERGAALVQLGRGTLGVRWFPPREEDAFETDRFQASLHDHADSPESALAFLAENTRRIVVIPDHQESFTSIVSQQIPLLLFTATDPFAVESAYALLTRPVDAAETLDLGMPPVELVFFGASPHEADVAATRICTTAQDCMGIDVAYDGWALRRVDELRAHEDVEIAVPEDFALSEFIAGVRVETSTERTTASQEFLRRLEREAGVQLETAGDDDEPADIPESEASFDAVEPPIGMEPELEPKVEPRERAELEAPLYPEPEDAPPTISDEPVRNAGSSLRPLFPGFLPVERSLPIDPDVETALDGEGCLHLIASEDRLRALRGAAVELGRWESLLVDVLELRPFSEGGLQLDLVVEDPAASSDLHGTGINLHYLLPVPDGARRLVPLNNERTARGH